MSEITLSKEKLEFLRNLLISRDPGPITFYPINVVQLSTRGENHNFTPIAMPVSGSLYPLEKDKIFRFYMDGLIFRFFCGNHDEFSVRKLGNTTVGYSDELHISLVDYYNSFQKSKFGKNAKNI
ncbi:hypothetical protein [Commensalibacter oyaizuii]|uniref:Uncharacterized protein n=1 Tax=Commensalibacter oyaizuii TaxID=3043873 RepID=A0ABT6PZ60_9PROT|nr:hypothetical protein [Commensalibacter sp. TBRC 16381]MDI2090141.1 hypothetical protein [Commensalibacter sp. TBRC 16381]